MSVALHFAGQGIATSAECRVGMLSFSTFIAGVTMRVGAGHSSRLNTVFVVVVWIIARIIAGSIDFCPF